MTLMSEHAWWLKEAVTIFPGPPMTPSEGVALTNTHWVMGLSATHR